MHQLRILLVTALLVIIANCQMMTIEPPCILHNFPCPTTTRPFTRPRPPTKLPCPTTVKPTDVIGPPVINCIRAPCPGRGLAEIVKGLMDKGSVF
ncbi:infB [Acrasis kona]|uniref:InfB n=1 Tax=Acrasis kona TaxID=1008807 RepID=A0AAW2ZMP1_9EUKA